MTNNDLSSHDIHQSSNRKKNRSYNSSDHCSDKSHQNWFNHPNQGINFETKLVLIEVCHREQNRCKISCFFTNHDDLDQYWIKKLRSFNRITKRKSIFQIRLHRLHFYFIVIIGKNFPHLIKRVNRRNTGISEITKKLGKLVHIKIDNNMFKSRNFEHGKIDIFFEKNLRIVQNRKHNTSSHYSSQDPVPCCLHKIGCINHKKCNPRQFIFLSFVQIHHRWDHKNQQHSNSHNRKKE